MSQPPERPSVRDRLTDVLDCGSAAPQHCFRLGRVDGTARHTPRWPVETFLAD